MLRTDLAALGAVLCIGMPSAHAHDTMDEPCRSPTNSLTRMICRDLRPQADNATLRYWRALDGAKTYDDYRQISRRVDWFRSELFTCTIKLKPEDVRACTEEKITSFFGDKTLPAPAGETPMTVDSASNALSRILVPLKANNDICRRNAAEALDDNTSPPADIAKAVASKCEKAAFLLVSTRLDASENGPALYPVSNDKGPSLTVTTDLTNRLYGPQATIETVLQARTARRVQQQPQGQQKQ
jgi:hypothetical protein